MTQRRSYFINGGVVGDGVGQMAGDPLGTLGDPLGPLGDPLAQGPGPLDPGARARALPGPSPSPHKQISQKFFKFFFLKFGPPGNHEKTTFRASLED